MDNDSQVEAGSETSGETADTAQAETTDTSDTAQADTDAQDAGGAADETAATSSETSGETADTAQAETTDTAVDADASRTGYADKGLHPGDQCTCPDGRTGTVHRFDAGLICIPNHDQG